ncbi:hypothetical protein KKG83_06805 [Candidatus Micrarchaeota archaeon]|nr:hypothetical protein [Candidatus Micrarchaeota archaeon]MBU2477153.1 hypothetical protein [Candidatus Micrarchaeota archaeon]
MKRKTMISQQRRRPNQNRKLKTGAQVKKAKHPNPELLIKQERRHATNIANSFYSIHKRLFEVTGIGPDEVQETALDALSDASMQPLIPGKSFTNFSTTIVITGLQ